ncbi:MAG: hypothetical protein GY870_17240, partial [archaeon]|nr:hypothetical protein [archaeon]
MFQPASLKGDSPTPIDEQIRKKYFFIYVIIIALSFVPCSLFEYTYYIILFNGSTTWIFFLFLPLNALFLIYLLQFSALFISFLLLTLIKLLHPPKEGIFTRDIRDKDYFYWNIRNLVKKWALFVVASNPFPWAKNRFSLRWFGVKIGKKCMCDDCWISSEFVSIGKNCIIGFGSTLLSFGIEKDKLILKKIVVEDNVILGAKSILMPGTIVKEKAKLSAHSYTNY